MRVLRIRPLGPARLASTPVLRAGEFFGGQRVLGVPLPSTVLGALGVALGVRLDKGLVEKDPLYGIGVLAHRLLGGSSEAGPVVEGPVIAVGGSGLERLALPIHTKRRVLFAKLESVLSMDPDEPRLSDADIVAATAPLVQTGVALADVLGEPWNRTVGYTFKRGLVVYEGREGRGVEVEFLYKTPLGPAGVQKLIRLGGEGRQALLTLCDESCVPEQVADLLEKAVTSPLEAARGYYMVLSYWPLLPRSLDALYIEKGSFVGLEFFDDPCTDIIGVPGVGPQGTPKRYAIRLGLGFSEVAKKRRPQVLALPPGTVIRIKRTFSELKSEVPRVYVELLRAGYASLARLAEG